MSANICNARVRDVLNALASSTPVALADFPLLPQCEKCSASEQTPYCVKYPFHAAAMMGDLAILSQVQDETELAWVNQYDSRGFTPLHCAVRKGHLNVVDWLLSVGADPNSATKAGVPSVDRQMQGVTSLYMASCLHDVVRPKLIVLLLEYGADPNHPAARDSIAGTTSLHNAACFGELEAVRALLDHGADAGAVTSSGHTVAMCTTNGMQYASSPHGDITVHPDIGIFRHGHAEILHLLKQHSRRKGNKS